MGKLIYSMFTSLDGYVAGSDGQIVGQIDEEIHTFANQQVQQVGTDIYGRRMYETMLYWETADLLTDSPDYVNEFTRLWKGLDKIVISSTLEKASSANTRVERQLRPDDIRRLKAESKKDIAVAGPTLASAFIAEGLVDEFGVYVVPVIVGGGIPFFKDVSIKLDLELFEEHRFRAGTVFLRYRPRN